MQMWMDVSTKTVAPYSPNCFHVAEIQYPLKEIIIIDQDTNLTLISMPYLKIFLPKIDLSG